MAIREILIFPDDRLRKPTTDVTVFDEKLKDLVQDMFETMYDADGIGLAAPQIGISKRLVTIDIADYDEEGNVTERHPLVLINPKIISSEGETDSTEGCLSVPTINETVTRAEKVTVEALDINGELQRYEADGLLAICMQHEIDHLNGRVFIDKLSTLKKDRISKKLIKLKKEKALEQKNQNK